jgi:purine-cytosine permease-like protein
MKLVDITFSEAWAYCWTQTSFIVSFWIFTILAIVCLVVGIVQYRKTQDAIWGIAGVALFLVILLSSWLSRPLSIKYNTSPEEQKRGVYVG